MKKTAMIFAAAIMSASAAFAQTEEAPNRILVTNTAGNYTGFVIDYTDAINFARVDGDVLANVVIDEVNLETMTLTVTRTPECYRYKLVVIPEVTAKQLTDDVNAIRYINSLPSDMVALLDQDFDHGTLSGIELNPESSYTIFTVGIDRYGVEAGVARAEFQTPAPEIIGDPHVDVEVVGSTQKSFTVKFTPNADVQSYWILAGEKGTMQSQYESFGPMFGFSNFSDMIRMWGIQCIGDYEYTWTEMSPNTEYDVFVAMTDFNGYFAPYEVYSASTSPLGGHGVAAVEISVGGYSLEDWDGAMKPTLTVSYVPNSEASCYRMNVFSAEDYDADPEGCDAYLCSEPPMPSMVGWFQYDPVSYEYPVEPGTSIVIAAAAKNIDGEWGGLNVVRYTTPATLEGYDPQPAAIPSFRPRQVKGIAPSLRQGVVPRLSAVKASKALTMTR